MKKYLEDFLKNTRRGRNLLRSTLRDYPGLTDARLIKKREFPIFYEEVTHRKPSGVVIVKDIRIEDGTLDVNAWFPFHAIDLRRDFNFSPMVRKWKKTELKNNLHVTGDFYENVWRKQHR